MTNRESSAAWQALSRSARKLVLTVEHELAQRGTREVALSYSSFLDAPLELVISRPVIRHSIKKAAALGFVAVALGPRRINVFALSDDWKKINNKAEAKRRLTMAKTAQPRPARQLQLGESKPAAPKISREFVRRAEPMEPVPQYRTPSLAKLRFMGEI